MPTFLLTRSLAAAGRVALVRRCAACFHHASGQLWRDGVCRLAPTQDRRGLRALPDGLCFGNRRRRQELLGHRRQLRAHAARRLRDELLLGGDLQQDLLAEVEAVDAGPPRGGVHVHRLGLHRLGGLLVEGQLHRGEALGPLLGALLPHPPAHGELDAHGGAHDDALGGGLAVLAQQDLALPHAARRGDGRKGVEDLAYVQLRLLPGAALQDERQSEVAHDVKQRLGDLPRVQGLGRAQDAEARVVVQDVHHEVEVPVRLAGEIQVLDVPALVAVHDAGGDHALLGALAALLAAAHGAVVAVVLHGPARHLGVVLAHLSVRGLDGLVVDPLMRLLDDPEVVLHHRHGPRVGLVHVPLGGQVPRVSVAQQRVGARVVPSSPLLLGRQLLLAQEPQLLNEALLLLPREHLLVRVHIQQLKEARAPLILRLRHRAALQRLLGRVLVQAQRLHGAQLTGVFGAQKPKVVRRFGALLRGRIFVSESQRLHLAQVAGVFGVEHEAVRPLRKQWRLSLGRRGRGISEKNAFRFRAPFRMARIWKGRTAPVIPRPELPGGSG
eukprot:scaffold1631_cov198-Pinguiococcus_pyrenoidosus.AAC.4